MKNANEWNEKMQMNGWKKKAMTSNHAQNIFFPFLWSIHRNAFQMRN